MIKKLCLIFTLAGFISCGSSGGDSSTTGTDNTPSNASENQNNSAIGTKLNLSYNFQIQIADENGINTPYSFPKNYTAPLYINSEGSVTIKAREFPKMVLRICPKGSVNSCDIYINSTDTDLGNGLDLVLDLCGFSKSHAECGPNDGTTFSGSLTDNGSLSISGIAVRVRVFNLDGGPNGNTASVTAGGFISDMPRITVSLKTNPDISINGLHAFGNEVSDRDVTLIGGGVIPANMPELGSASYVITLDGTFNQAPLDLLN